MNDWPDTNESLILRVKDPADGAAWTTFLSIYRPVVFRLARAKGLQHADADDLTQKVFVSIARSVERWQPGDGLPPFRAWVRQIAQNEILKSLTRRKPDQAAGSSSAQLELLSIEDPADATAELLHESRREVFRWAAEAIRPEFTATTWSMFWEATIESIR